ncbi:ATPase/DNA packaging protein [Adoxophyes honmai entomopoxvirus 'L']|uniref:DNA packaging protein OPG160 n=1 Tax=Adoxophyes honmai entomopoxvirus 'L' TaxID=1293540 RepID=A0A916P0N2_9POXV|nr:ATPase/DNA packaging protein [Adoxophyes honmai entomopoxvirus 'L']CCU55501.1 ATPase/DNA packaging protein [Adoxophyes honmai entomopoxvirus 'L']
MAEFEYNSLRNKPFNMAILGKTGSGKTTFLKNLLINIGFGYFKFVYLITSSEVNFKSNDYYKYIYPNHVFYIYKYKDNKDTKDTKLLLQSFLNKIKLFSFDIKAKYDCNTLVIYDDIGKETKEKLDNFTNECRHSNISNIFLVHRLEHLDTTTRDSISHYVINSPSENLDYIKYNKAIKNDMLSKIINIYSEYTNKGLYVIINEPDIFTSIITKEDIEKIKTEDKYVIYTDSVIRKYILEDYNSDNTKCIPTI